MAEGYKEAELFNYAVVNACCLNENYPALG